MPDAAHRDTTSPCPVDAAGVEGQPLRYAFLGESASSPCRPTPIPCIGSISITAPSFAAQIKVNLVDIRAVQSGWLRLRKFADPVSNIGMPCHFVNANFSWAASTVRLYLLSR